MRCPIFLLCQLGGEVMESDIIGSGFQGARSSELRLHDSESEGKRGRKMNQGERNKSQRDTCSGYLLRILKSTSCFPFPDHVRFL